MNPLETYLKELSEIHSCGAAVKETSYYGPLANLLNEIIKTLKPRVRCIINLQNQVAGLPEAASSPWINFRNSLTLHPQLARPQTGGMEVRSYKGDS
jgi:hypothetical protein